MVVFPNAKINLGLNIIRRRPDGYHDIESVMVGIDWRDILEIVPSRNGQTTLTVTGRHVDCPMEKNLVIKAYRALAENIDLPPVEIHLHKIIPDGAGLGGGSADAAFMIIALNELFDLHLTLHEMAEVAGKVGSDCPFFIYDRPMLATETGKVLAPVDIDLKGYKVLVVKPDVSVSTAQAYSGVTPCPSECDIVEILRCKAVKWQSNGLKNDFEPSVFAVAPEIQRVKQRLEDTKALYVSMSGSGSSVYAIYDDEKEADRAAALFDGTVARLCNFI